MTRAFTFWCAAAVDGISAIDPLHAMAWALGALPLVLAGGFAWWYRRRLRLLAGPAR